MGASLIKVRVRDGVCFYNDLLVEESYESNLCYFFGRLFLLLLRVVVKKNYLFNEQYEFCLYREQLYKVLSHSVQLRSNQTSTCAVHFLKI